ncbi:MAG: ABC transporter [Clostridia bacterium BRH_c25]|nr:MAG: ABC transporter [Clostridia bacterium BRH_c25]
MVIIYNCYGGTHSSILASAIHLRKLPMDRIPTKQEILNIEYFNKLTYSDMGRLIFHGSDDEGNRIYTIGRGTSKALVPAMRNLAIALCKDSGIDEHFLFINCSPTVPPLMTMGGFFSRALHMDFIGVPLLAAGARQTYYNIAKLVEKSKEICRENSINSLVVNMDEKGRLSVFN